VSVADPRCLKHIHQPSRHSCRSLCGQGRGLCHLACRGRGHPQTLPGDDLVSCEHFQHSHISCQAFVFGFKSRYHFYFFQLGLTFLRALSRNFLQVYWIRKNNPLTRWCHHPRQKISVHGSQPPAAGQWTQGQDPRYPENARDSAISENPQGKKPKNIIVPLPGRAIPRHTCSEEHTSPVNSPHHKERVLSRGKYFTHRPAMILSKQPSS